MALLKEKTMDNGAQGNYWRITSIEVNRLSMRAKFSIDLFCSKQHSIDKKPSLNFKKGFEGKFTKEQLSSDLMSLGYTFIKAQVITCSDLDLEGAIDA